MKLKTYSGSECDDIVHFAQSALTATPGDWVMHKNSRHAEGMIVAIDMVNEPGVMTILWSVAPSEENDFMKFVMPLVRQRFSPNVLARDLISIQPMSLPSGSLFYLDYTYTKEDKRCNSGPWVCRVMWRTYYRWLTTPMRLKLASSLRSLRSSFTTSMRSASTLVRRLGRPRPR